MKPKTRTNTLRQAASAVFAVTAVVPLLIFVWTLHHLDALGSLPAQVGLGLALGIALLGFHIFRRLMGRMSDLILALGKVVERGARPVAPPASPVPAAPPARAAWATPAPPPPRPPSPSPAPAPAPEPASRPATDPRAVPGLGAIREVHDLNRAMTVLWQAEAATHVGRRVAVSVTNAPRPRVGTLLEMTDEGLLLETDGAGRVTARYEHISGIDAEEPARSAP